MASTETAHSLLDTDLYKLTMQAAVLKFFPDVQVWYKYTNRTGAMKFTREGYEWLRGRVDALANVSLTDNELAFLQQSCPYFKDEYLDYLKSFRFKPAEQVELLFEPLKGDSERESSQRGDLIVSIKGLWIETILYEIPLLALISEAYFKFCSKDWDHHDQEAKAQAKCEILLENGCFLSEFGTRRRRDYHTQDLVVKGCCKAAEKAIEKGWKGKFTGTSNVHFAMKYGIPPVGTVAHEWYMGIAAITNNYEDANELGLKYWVETFGPGVLGIALTDTFGSAACFKALRKAIPSADSGTPAGTKQQSYAEVFAGVRQDSGDPANFVKMSRDFYDLVGVTEKKSIVFSDSLNIELCLEYKKLAEEAGFQPSFGVGTFFTNDFVHKTDGGKSVPLNIVIKLSHANGRHAVKISDNSGKNTGDAETVKEVKARLGYAEQEWKEGNESGRWGQEGR